MQRAVYLGGPRDGEVVHVDDDYAAIELTGLRLVNGRHVAPGFYAPQRRMTIDCGVVMQYHSGDPSNDLILLAPPTMDADMVDEVNAHYRSLGVGTRVQLDPRHVTDEHSEGDGETPFFRTDRPHVPGTVRATVDGVDTSVLTAGPMAVMFDDPPPKGAKVVLTYATAG